MSRTDAHHPYWVQVMHAAQDHKWYSYEWHNHESNACDLADETFHRRRVYRWKHCTHDIDWSRVNKCHSRWRGAKYSRQQYWGAERARVRAQLAAENYEIAPSNHRHSVLWDW